MNHIKNPANELGRHTFIDQTRGLAIVLMVISHTVMALVHKQNISDIGNVIHLFTKMSSQLFFITFGMGIFLYARKHIFTDQWNEKKWLLVKKGITILCLYKLLTVIQLLDLHNTKIIFAAMVYDYFPDFTEVLGFYGLFLLWFPFFLPCYFRLTAIKRGMFAVVLFLSGNWLSLNFSFFDWRALKIILVEQANQYTFGQFQRGAIVIFGMLLAQLWMHLSSKERPILTFDKVLQISGVIISLSYFVISSSDWLFNLYYLSLKNLGKHPPNLSFMTITLGPTLLALAYFYKSTMAKNNKFIFSMLSHFGRHALLFFSTHIIIIFFFCRYLFDLRFKFSYGEALFFACVILLISALFAKLFEKKEFFMNLIIFARRKNRLRSANGNL